MRADFSIIVPTYNRPAELTACLDALAALDFPRDRFEVIVVDDGSEPPAAQVVGRFAHSLAVTSIRQSRSGPAGARNAGAGVASGTYLAFTDDDCRPAPGWLSAFSSVLNSQPMAMTGGGTLNALVESACSTASHLVQDLVYTHYNADPLHARFFASNNIAMSACEFRAIGGFDGCFRTSEDRDLCDRWRASGRAMIYVPQAMVFHAHRLGLAGFWKQHVGYGRGARRFHLARRLRDPNSSIVDGRFYWGLLRRAANAVARSRRPWSIGFLLAVWQVANLSGFLAEAFFPRQTPSGSRHEAV
jgi:GT2 family glycosyltransferase